MSGPATSDAVSTRSVGVTAAVAEVLSVVVVMAAGGSFAVVGSTATVPPGRALDQRGKPCEGRSRDNPADGSVATWHDADVDTPDLRLRRELLPLLAVSAAVVLVAFGFGRGLWLSNLHNGILALAFTCVGAYVAVQRPGHREAML